MEGVFNLNSIIVIVVLISMVVAGFIANRKSKSSEDYIMAGRSLKWPVIGFHGMASYVGAGTMGTIGAVYVGGISGVWYLIALSISYLIMVLLVPKLRKVGSKAVTIGDLIGTRYNPKLRLIYGIACGPIMLFGASAQLVALAGIGSIVMGLDFQVMVLIFGIVALVYTYLGGFLAVAYTDFIQGVIIVVAFVALILPGVLLKTGGFSSEAFTSLTPDKLAIFPENIKGLLGTIFVFGFLLSFFTTEAQRMVFAAKSESHARKGFIFATILMIPIIVIVCIAGLAAGTLIPGVDRTDLVFPSLVTTILPDGLAGLAFAGLVAAVLSTLDTIYITAAVIIYNDVILRLYKKDLSDRQVFSINKLIILVIGIATILVALLGLDVLTLVYLSYDISAMVLAAPILAAFFWPRATTKATLVSMIVGMIIWPVLTYLEMNAVLIGFPILMATMIIVSLVDKPNPEEQLRSFYKGMKVVAGGRKYTEVENIEA